MQLSDDMGLVREYADTGSEAAFEALVNRHLGLVYAAALRLSFTNYFPLGLPFSLRHILFARAHGLWTYEPRQGRKAATVVCSASAVVTLAL